VAFYRAAFHAIVEEVTEVGGLIAHAQLDYGLGRLTLSDPLPAYGLSAARSAEEANYSLALYVPDVDSVVARAVERGATVREPLANFVSGDRYSSIVDPFGVRWSIMTRVEDISDEVSARRVRDWAAGLQRGKDGTAWQ
jgi:PhnB protein